MEGVFTISLDFELHWGVFDKRNRDSRKDCYLNTLRLVPQMLELFAKHDVHVTWATVGSMFASDEQEWEKIKPAAQPDYVIEKYCPYKWAKQNGLSDHYRWAHFAPEAIADILKYPGQELGTHTFSHYYCLEELKGAEAFNADLQAARLASAKFQNEPVSLVFPRNQFNPYYLKICYENGIKTVRSNPFSWFWSPITDKQGNLLRKIFRTGDAYFPMGGGRTSYPLSVIKVQEGEPLQLPASRLLRPWSAKYKIANKLGLKRVINELHNAAKHKECYHLWWHPENFGDHPEENMANLKIILQQYTECKKRYGMTSWNMGEYATYLS